jgi:hypothetical protein
MTRQDRHALVHYGTERMNLANRHNLTTHFRDRHGELVEVRRSRAPGIHFGFVDSDGAHLVVFRVHDVTLNKEIRVPVRRLRLKGGISPSGKRIPDKTARLLLDEALAAASLDQKQNLQSYYGLLRL